MGKQWTLEDSVVKFIAFELNLDTRTFTTSWYTVMKISNRVFNVLGFAIAVCICVLYVLYHAYTNDTVLYKSTNCRLGLHIYWIQNINYELEQI